MAALPVVPLASSDLVQNGGNFIVEAGPAEGVYALQSTDAYPAEGGAAQPVYVVSAAEITAGRGLVRGTGPRYMKQVASGSRPLIGGAAKPVYVLGGAFDAALLGGGAAFVPDFYVTKSGNDSTGDGSSTKPWLTIDKAMTTVTSGKVVGIGPGTYAENSLGVGLLRVTGVFTSPVVFRSLTDVASDVVIFGASHASVNTQLITNVAFVTFKNVTFTSRLSSQASAVLTTGNCNHITFDGCVFKQNGTNGSVVNGFLSNGNPSVTQNILTFTNCTAIANDGNYLPIAFNGTDATTIVTNLSITNCNIVGGFNAINLNGITSATISGGSIRSAASSAIRIGLDAATGGLPTTVTVQDCAIDMTGATGGHCVMVGNGALNCVLDNVTAQAFNYAVVLKEHGASGGTEVKNCAVSYTGGGSGAAILHKAAQNSNVHNNTLLSNAPGLGVIYFTAGDTGNKNSNNNINHNTVTATGAGTIFYWIAGSDSGGNVNDFNTYTLASGGWGEIPTGVVVGVTIAALRSAWSGYGDGSNDSHSTVS